MTVAGPWWSLRPDSPVYRQARIASAAEPADMDFEPVKQTVTAQVDARFGMLLPESG